MTAGEAFDDDQVVELLQAALSGERERALAIASKCECVNADGRGGVTPLLWAMGARDLEAVRILLTAGANPDRTVAELESATTLAASGDSAELLEVLLEHGADPKQRGADAMPLLHLAALHHRPRNVEVLLEYGADVNATTPKGKVTAAEVAVGQGRMELAYRLLQAGASENLQGVGDVLRYRSVPADSEAARWKERLQEELRARGVDVTD